jgi:endonuclease YncB( thermonuclease family)
MAPPEITTRRAGVKLVVRTLVAVLSFLFATSAHAFDAIVTYCHDGDTCTLSDGTRVRLHAIDAPELDQPYGEQARLLINSLVAGHHVDVRPTGDFSYRRMVADLVLPGKFNVGAVLVTRGYAWVEARWNTDPYMPARQSIAQQTHVGLWADANPIPPWVWRHEHMYASPFTRQP